MKKSNRIMKKLNNIKQINNIRPLRKLAKMKRNAEIDLDDLDNEQQIVYDILSDNRYSDEEILELLKNREYTFYECSSMEEVAEDEVYDYDLLDVLPKNVLQDIIDYEKLGEMLFANWEIYEGDCGYVRVY